ncbi:MAG: Gfo/Idh/MocA family protein [Limisphaerales bacterium]
MNAQPISTESMKTSRREFIGSATKLVAASALAGVALPHVHAAESNTIQLALIGCGGRGTGAVGNAFDSTGGPVKLVAMADVAEHKLKTSYDALHNYAARVDVPEERKFLGFDAYRKAMDCLHPGDVAVLTTHCAFRGLHLQYAIEKGLNVFMEKSFAPDPAGLKNILKLGEAAEKKDLKIGTGLMCRHSASRNALIQKIREGALGDIELIRAYRMEHGYHLGPQKAGAGELLRQISVPYYFMWAASGLFIELMIHQIDECCWIKDSWPVSAHGMGGRVYGNTDCSQNLDTYSIEFTFADGTKALVQHRNIPNSYDDFSTFIQGTKCAAQFSGNVHAPTTHIYKDQKVDRRNISWKPAPEAVSPYVQEWSDLLGAIRQNRPYNEVKRSAYSNIASIMGRSSVHLNRIVTWEETMASEFQFCKDINFTKDSPAPVHADEQGRYPVPVPGSWTEL